MRNLKTTKINVLPFDNLQGMNLSFSVLTDNVVFVYMRRTPAVLPGGLL